MEQVYVNSVDCILHLEGTSTYDWCAALSISILMIAL